MMAKVTPYCYLFHSMICFRTCFNPCLYFIVASLSTSLRLLIDLSRKTTNRLCLFIMTSLFNLVTTCITVIISYNLDYDGAILPRPLKNMDCFYQLLLLL